MPDKEVVILSEEAVREIEARANNSPLFNAETYAFDLRRVCQTVRALRAEGADLTARITELERRLRIPFGKFPCALCGGPHDFDTSVPSVVWNSVIRAREQPDYLCTTCIVREFVRAGQGFTAELWNGELNGIDIEVVVNGQNAKDAAAVQEENNALRNRLAQVEQERGVTVSTLIGFEAGIDDFRTRAINLCREKAADLSRTSIAAEQNAEKIAVVDELCEALEHLDHQGE